MASKRYTELLKAQHGFVRVQMAEGFLQAHDSLTACYYGRDTALVPFATRVWAVPGGSDTVDFTPGPPWSSEAERKDCFDKLHALIACLYSLAFNQRAQTEGVPEDERNPLLDGVRMNVRYTSEVASLRGELSSLWGITFGNIAIQAVPTED